MTVQNQILLILPCTNVKPYTKSPSWRYVLDHLEPWRQHISLAAIDCITNPSTGKPFGIVPVSEEDKVVGLDEKPNPQKLPALVESIRTGLAQIRSEHGTIIAYVNVKSYWQALEEVAEEFNIHLLPSAYRKTSDWSVANIGASPLGVFRKCVNELVDEIRSLTEAHRQLSHHNSFLPKLHP